MEQNLKTLLGEPIEPYNNESIKPGVICTTVVPYIPRNLNVIEPLSYDPASAESRKYQLLSMEYTQLRPYLGGAKPPHMELGVRSDEAVLAYKIKVRPVVVLTPCLTEEVSGFPSHFKNCILCAPLYTLVEEDGNMNPSYNPDVVQGVVALKYRSVFPLPTYPYTKSRICALGLDRIQPTRLDLLMHLRAKVRNKWLSFIREWVRFYVTGRLGEKQKPKGRETVAEYLGEVRAILLEAISEPSPK